MARSRADAVFTCFRKLPLELRLQIWELASLHPRIVHLSKKQLVVDDDPGWWKTVRSDKSNGEEPFQSSEEDDAESDYGLFYLDEYDIEELDRKAAATRLLTPDGKYKGGMTRADAKAILRRIPLQLPPPLYPGYNCPRCLYGLKSESPVPGVLLACRESFGVSCRVYSPAFGALGAMPLYFNFGQDTLYLDDLGPSVYDYPRPGNIIRLLRHDFAPDELVRIENLAIRYNFIYWNPNYEDRDEELCYWLLDIQTMFPNIRRFTIVNGHYAHRDRTVSKDRAGDDYLNLKFMDSTLGSDLCWRLNGFRIDAALLHEGIHPNKGHIDKQLDEAQKFIGNPRWCPTSYKLPPIDIKIITSLSDEERLLQEAYLFEKQNMKGCWYINPCDSTDCNYFAGDEIDEDIESLL